MTPAMPRSVHRTGIVVVAIPAIPMPMHLPVIGIGSGNLIGGQLFRGFRRGAGIGRRQLIGKRYAADERQRSAKKQYSFHDDLPGSGTSPVSETSTDGNSVASTPRGDLVRP
jgi:hypothetical protein